MLRSVLRERVELHPPEIASGSSRAPWPPPAADQIASDLSDAQSRSPERDQMLIAYVCSPCRERYIKPVCSVLRSALSRPLHLRSAAVGCRLICRLICCHSQSLAFAQSSPNPPPSAAIRPDLAPVGCCGQRTGSVPRVGACSTPS
jgi:hypothetical protein